MKNQAAPGARWVCSVNDVTIPKLPPPPPRHAQYRSSLVSASTWRTRPSAVTIVAAVRLSVVSPKRRPARPWPPPSVRPEMPTDGHEPEGTDSPRRVSARCMSINCTPAPTLALPFDTLTPPSFERSTTTPLPVVE